LIKGNPSQNLAKGKSLMPNFRRYYRPGVLVFITSVTRNRRPYLESDQSIVLLFETMRNVQRIDPFRLLAYVILPDHFHWLMYVDDEKGDFFEGDAQREA